MARKLPLPRGWRRRVKSSIVHILALSHCTFTALVARAANHRNRRTRLRAEIDRLNHELALLQEELRIKDARMERVPPHRRPNSPSTQPRLTDRTISDAADSRPIR